MLSALEHAINMPSFMSWFIAGKPMMLNKYIRTDDDIKRAANSW